MQTPYIATYVDLYGHYAAGRDRVYPKVPSWQCLMNMPNYIFFSSNNPTLAILHITIRYPHQPDFPGTGRWGKASENCGTTPPSCQEACSCSNGTSACDVGQACFWFSSGCTIGCDACDGNGRRDGDPCRPVTPPPSPPLSISISR